MRTSCEGPNGNIRKGMITTTCLTGSKYNISSNIDHVFDANSNFMDIPLFVLQHVHGSMNIDIDC